MWKHAEAQRFDVLPFRLNYLRRLKDHAMAFKSYTEQYINTSTHLVCSVTPIISILATIAEQERIRRSDRTKAGLERASAQGRRLGRPESQNPSRTTMWRRAQKTTQQASGQQ
jgi:DNA invertase Pin-like site-specific DNA recombinase